MLSLFQSHLYQQVLTTHLFNILLNKKAEALCTICKEFCVVLWILSSIKIKVFILTTARKLPDDNSQMSSAAGASPSVALPHKNSSIH